MTDTPNSEEHKCIEERSEEVNAHKMEAQQSGGIILACGMAKHENDACAATVFNVQTITCTRIRTD